MILRDGEIVDRAPNVEPPSAVEGVFTTIGCQHGRPLLFNRHRARLQDSLSELSPDVPVTLPSENQLENLLKSEGLAHGAARIRVVVWPGDDGVFRTEASAAAAGPPMGPGRDPVRLEVVRWNSPPDPSHKWLEREKWAQALRVARACGCDDALLVDRNGRVLETSIANVVLRCGSTLMTPPAPQMCLPGIMRGWLMEAVPITEQELDLESLLGADEVWLTNAVAGIVRVGLIGSRIWRSWRVFDEIKQSGVPAPGWPGSHLEWSLDN